MFICCYPITVEMLRASFGLENDILLLVYDFFFPPYVQRIPTWSSVRVGWDPFPISKYCFLFPSLLHSEYLAAHTAMDLLILLY